ncbi:MAG: flavodoxin [Candidatus Latescibacteria bacterium]|nr:flavodoxin [bacterium]MBD3422867.1 flavodoxin [Candidatus Latescibacterota bacterium]
MQGKVLVAFATRYGATAEIADRIGGVLRREGLEADVVPAGRVKGLAGYRAVVLGSAVYIGRWRKSAARLLKKHEDELAGMELWLFSSGPTGEGDPEKLTGGWSFPKKLKPVAERLRPHDTALFHGAIDSKKLNFLHRWMIGKVEAPAGDYRDWDRIESWAVQIAEELRGGQGQTAGK